MFYSARIILVHLQVGVKQGGLYLGCTLERGEEQEYGGKHAAFVQQQNGGAGNGGVDGAEWCDGQ